MRKPRCTVPKSYRHTADHLARSLLDLPFDAKVTTEDLHEATIKAIGLKIDLEQTRRGWRNEATSYLNSLSNLADLRERNTDGIAWMPVNDAIRAARKAMEITGDEKIGDYRQAMRDLHRHLQARLEADIRKHRAWRMRTFEIGLILGVLLKHTGMTGETITKMNELARELVDHGGRG